MERKTTERKKARHHRPKPRSDRRSHILMSLRDCAINPLFWAAHSKFGPRSLSPVLEVRAS